MSVHIPAVQVADGHQTLSSWHKRSKQLSYYNSKHEEEKEEEEEEEELEDIIHILNNRPSAPPAPLCIIPHTLMHHPKSSLK